MTEGIFFSGKFDGKAMDLSWMNPTTYNSNFGQNPFTLDSVNAKVTWTTILLDIVRGNRSCLLRNVIDWTTFQNRVTFPPFRSEFELVFLLFLTRVFVLFRLDEVWLKTFIPGSLHCSGPVDMYFWWFRTGTKCLKYKFFCCFPYSLECEA